MTEYDFCKCGKRHDGAYCPDCVLEAEIYVPSKVDWDDEKLASLSEKAAKAVRELTDIQECGHPKCEDIDCLCGIPIETPAEKRELDWIEDNNAIFEISPNSFAFSFSCSFPSSVGAIFFISLGLFSR